MKIMETYIMSTTTMVKRSSEWGISPLEDGWCSEEGELCEEELGQMVVDEFHNIARENNSSAFWSPQTSEVMASIDEGQDLIDQYDDWRTTASDIVGSKWANSEI